MIATHAPRLRAITPRHPNWFRVMRAFRTAAGDVHYECIAETSDSGPAAVMASAEPTRAVVTRWDSKQVFNNGKEIEDRAGDSRGGR